jgi:hypothetical protein
MRGSFFPALGRVFARFLDAALTAPATLWVPVKRVTRFRRRFALTIHVSL